MVEIWSFLKTFVRLAVMIIGAFVVAMVLFTVTVIWFGAPA